MISPYTSLKKSLKQKGWESFQKALKKDRIPLKNNLKKDRHPRDGIPLNKLLYKGKESLTNPTVTSKET